MVWSDTGHEWVPTSPHIPTARSAAAYAATGILGELYVINIGVGYTLPFEMVGSPWIDGETLANSMPKHNGIIFRPVHFKPFYGTFKGEPCQGVQVHIDPKTADNLVQVNYELVSLLGAPQLFPLSDDKAKQEAEDDAKTTEKKTRKPATRPIKFDRRSTMFDKVSGSDEPRKWLMEQKDLSDLFAKWKRECDHFRQTRKPYLLY
jgi:uncharacterized protein YbbC (DUF1343 family)